jgi:2-oxoisovalerate dehydrogenase E2 component (dihydrolipoyl transacylase)
MATTIKMPQLGESVTEGTIERWLVKEGDTVEQYDPLFEVVTDKVNAEVPAEVAGKITKIIVGDGETVKVGTPLAEISTDGDGAGAEAEAAPAEAQTEATAPVEAQAEPAAAEAGATQAQAEMPAQPAAAAEPEAQEPQQAAAPAASEPPQPTATATSEAAPETEPAEADAEQATNGSVRMTPAVRRLVREHGIDISQLRGSGAGGRVTRDDVLAFLDKGAAAPSAAPEPEAGAAEPAVPQAATQPAAPAPEQPAAAAAAPSPAPAPAEAPAAPAAAAAYKPPAPVAAPSGQDVEMPLTQMRRGIAKKMTQVKQTVPHAYTVVEVDMTNVVRWREANNEAYRAREGSSLSYVAAVVKAVTETLREHPTVNSQFADDKVILKHELNIGIAVAVDNGLIVPVIRNADQLSINGVNQRIRDLSSRANANKLRLDDLQGGTFTVNNTGWFGSVSSMPIINAPEVAILSMEAIVKRPRVIEVDGADVIAIRHMMNMTCSFDHRVLDGAQVGSFLADVRKRLEGWSLETPIS